jgi:Domain of unknown function (DUF4345)
MELSDSKRLLQIAVAIGGIVPVGAGAIGIVLGPAFVDSSAAHAVSLDSHFRYLSGLLFAIGLAFWATIPDIEHRGKFFRLLTAIVFIGGLSRLWSLGAVGIPDGRMIFGLIMELVVTPALAFWQYWVARRPSHTTSHAK